MTPARIYLVRHGETTLNADGRCQGQSDSELTELGRRQIDELATSLAHVDFDAAYTSPLERAARTAERVLRSRGLRAATVPELAELSYGTLQGTRFAEWPDDLQATWHGDPCSVTFPGGESLAMLRARVVPVFHAIASAHAGESVLVSTHGHVNRVILLEVLERPMTEFWTVEQRNGSFTMIDVPAGAVA